MAISQDRSNRKVSGGRYRRTIKKLKNRGREPTLVSISKLKRKVERGRGNKVKYRVLSTDIVNLFDGKNFIKAKVESVIESPSNPNYVRRNIITKGSIIRTDKGNAKVTSRPGQEGSLNAVLIK